MLAHNMEKYIFFYIANSALRQGLNKLSLQLYCHSFHKYPLLQDMIESNIEIVKMMSENSIEFSTYYFEKQTSKLDKHKDIILLTIEDFNIQNIVDTGGIYCAENTDPCFTVNKELIGYTAGLYGVSFYLFSNIDLRSQVSKVYVDYGEGFSEENVFLIPLKPGLNERVVFFHKAPVSIRFDPIEVKVEFCVLDFEITTIKESRIKDFFSNVISNKKEPLPNNERPILDFYYKYSELLCVDNKVTYEDWMERNEAFHLTDASRLSVLQDFFSNDLLFSVCLLGTSLENTYVEECISSVLQQSFKNYEICISENSLSMGEKLKVIRICEEQDIELRFTIIENNDIASILKSTSGRYTLVLNINDKLSLDALYYCANAIYENHNTKLIYSDEDQIDKLGIRSNPHFKSGWNPDLLFSYNYISNLMVCASDLLKNIGFFNYDFQNNLNYDVILKCLPYLEDKNIVHIPHILYHKRVLELSDETSLSNYISDFNFRALQQYFHDYSHHPIGVEKGLLINTFKVNWPIPSSTPKVSILIPTRDAKEITELAVRSILNKTNYKNYNILIIDNGSEEKETLVFFEEIQAEDERVSVIRYDYPFNYSAINNFGVEHSDGEVIALVNNDIEVINPEWLTEMVMHVVRPEIGCVGAKLYYPNGQVQHAGVVLGIGGVANHISKFESFESVGYFNKLQVVQNYSAVTAACLLIRRDVFNEVEGLDANTFKVAYNDVDLCLKVLSRGYRNLWTPYAQLYHHESVSRGGDESGEKFQRLLTESEFMKFRWESLIEEDRYFNPNFSKESINYELRDNYTKELCFEGNILYDCKSEFNKYHDNVCVFVNYDSKSVLQEYVIVYLKHLSQYFDIIFVSTSEGLHKSKENIDVLRKFCQRIIIRKNEGYDFGSWRLGLELIEEHLNEYDNLLLCNDSVYGPFHHLGDVLNEFNTSDLDAMGLVMSQEIQTHLQSYFVLYKPNLFLSKPFKDFWSAVKIHSRKWDIIKNYEIGFSQRLLRVFSEKYKIGAYCDTSDLPVVNVTQVYWKELLLNRGFPFIKVELLRDNPFRVDIEDWEEVIKEVSEYDTTIISKHLKGMNIKDLLQK